VGGRANPIGEVGLLLHDKLAVIGPSLYVELFIHENENQALDLKILFKVQDIKMHIKSLLIQSGL